MKLKIIAVHNRGDASKEYVLLQATEDVDVGYYLLADSTYLAGGGLSNKLRHVFWFPDKRVKKGELVSLWTGRGTSTSALTKDGFTVHRFFWNLGTAVWNDDKDCAVLIEAKTWSAKSAK